MPEGQSRYCAACRWFGDHATAGLQEAYQQYIGNGWNGLNSDVRGAGGYRVSLAPLFSNCLSRPMSAGLQGQVSHGAVETVKHHGTALYFSVPGKNSWLAGTGLPPPWG